MVLKMFWKILNYFPNQILNTAQQKIANLQNKTGQSQSDWYNTTKDTDNTRTSHGQPF